MIFLVLALILGVKQLIDNYTAYGPSYVETVMINGTMSQMTVTIMGSIVSIGLLLWLLALDILLTDDMLQAGRTKGGL